jgi:hypothetical protein
MNTNIVRDKLLGKLARSVERGRTEAVERVGVVAGALVAPLFAATSALRRARTFHPRGDCADAIVELVDDVPEEHRALAAGLVGRAFVRFADALTRKQARWPDVIGCAVRFGGNTPSADGNQDLLFATIKRPWTMPFAPLTTRVGDYLANDYFAVSPFSVPGHARVWLRLHPDMSRSVERPSMSRSRQNESVRRRRRLERAIANGAAVLVLGVADGPRGPFRPIVRIRLVSIWQTDPPGLRFDPFRSGRGIEPRGFVHALRRGAYSASQRARR